MYIFMYILCIYYYSLIINLYKIDNNSLDKFLASSGSLRSDNKLLNSFSNKFSLYDTNVNNNINNNSIPVSSSSSFSPVFNFAPSASLPININGIPIKGAISNSRNSQQQQHLNQISETPDLWELDMEPYFEQNSLSKDDSNWFSVDYKNNGSHFTSTPMSTIGGNNNSFNNSLNGKQSKKGNSVDLNSLNDNNSNNNNSNIIKNNNNNNNNNISNSLDFQHINYPFNLNNFELKQNNMNILNQGTSTITSSSLPSSVMDQNIWSSIIPSLINNNNNNNNNNSGNNNINESISLLQKTLAASNLANNTNSLSNDNNTNTNINTINNNNNNINASILSKFSGFNDLTNQTNNLQLLNQLNELSNTINTQNNLLNVNAKTNNGNNGVNINKISNVANLHPSSAAINIKKLNNGNNHPNSLLPSSATMLSMSSDGTPATLSKPINIRNPERRDFASAASYNGRLISNTPSSSFSSFFSTSPNSFFSMGGYSGSNIPAAPNNSFNFGANFKTNNLNLNNTTSNNLESWNNTNINPGIKVLEPPLVEVPRTWYFSKDEAAKNSETIVLPKRYFKNEISECYDNRNIYLLIYFIL